MKLERMTNGWYTLPNKGYSVYYIYQDDCWALYRVIKGVPQAKGCYGSLESAIEAIKDLHPEFRTNLYKILWDGYEPTLIDKLKRLFYDI